MSRARSIRAWSTGGSSPLRERFFRQSTTSAVGSTRKMSLRVTLWSPVSAVNAMNQSPELGLSVSLVGGVISENPLVCVFQGFLFVLDAEVSHAHVEVSFAYSGECIDLVGVDVLHRLRPEISLSDLGVEPFGYVVVEVGVPYSGTDEETFVAGCELAAMDPPVLVEDVDTEDLLGSVSDAVCPILGLVKSEKAEPWCDLRNVHSLSQFLSYAAWLPCFSHWCQERRISPANS